MSMTTELAQRMKAAAEQAAFAHKHLDGLSVAAESFDFIELTTPTNVLALVEALEAAEKRIAELEARTVKLPLPRRKTADDYVDAAFEACDLAAIYNACRLECEVKFKKALDAAGVAVEGE